ncbi:MAG: hypothetical protein ACO1TE_28530 [Prosthecobacter sp.]
MKHAIFFFCLLLALSAPAHADYGAYADKHEINGSNGRLWVKHVHDWDSDKLEPLFSDLQHHDKFFTAANDFSYLEVGEVNGNRLLFRTPCPALMHVWVSQDSQYVVGLSNIMLYNPYQLMVWRRDGTLLWKEHISSEVARLTPEHQREFARRFPDAADYLAKTRTFTHGGVTYVDCHVLGVINVIGDDAWHYLHALDVRHPYASDMFETVTNFVYWYDAKNPAPTLRQVEKKGLVLTVRSPNGRTMQIPLTR